MLLLEDGGYVARKKTNKKKIHRNNATKQIVGQGWRVEYGLGRIFLQPIETTSTASIHGLPSSGHVLLPPRRASEHELESDLRFTRRAGRVHRKNHHVLASGSLGCLPTRRMGRSPESYSRQTIELAGNLFGIAGYTRMDATTDVSWHRCRIYGSVGVSALGLDD
jgi:hypothetical protein